MSEKPNPWTGRTLSELVDLSGPNLQSDEPAYCGHMRKKIDRMAREVRCARCGVKLDPFDVLANIGEQLRREFEAARQARQAANEHAESVRTRKATLRSLDGKIARRKAKIEKLEAERDTLDRESSDRGAE